MSVSTMSRPEAPYHPVRGTVERESVRIREGEVDDW